MTSIIQRTNKIWRVIVARIELVRRARDVFSFTAILKADMGLLMFYYPAARLP